MQPWIWVCKNNHCERRLKTQLGTTDENNGHSFRTCNMLCGSTQLWPQPTGPISLGSSSVSFLSKQLYLEAEVPFAVSANFISVQFILGLTKELGSYMYTSQSYIILMSQK